MKYFGIRKPDGTIWWIANTSHDAWYSFFTYPLDQELKHHRIPLEEAIRAYQAIGYRCVELEVREKSSSQTKDVES